MLLAVPSHKHVGFESAVMLTVFPVDCVNPYSGAIITVPMPAEDLLPLLETDDGEEQAKPDPQLENRFYDGDDTDES